ncbi:MAG: hypothetical protein LBN33_08840 [Desulfovibrio sp.]|jgi:hypothetical protein|nr:hypothetical protein [Desulfovibrio sp.]
MERILSEEFENDLLSGKLAALLARVKNDNTLMLAIRKKYINIYYRGGSLLNLSEKSEHKYEASFDAKYAKGSIFNVPDSPKPILTQDDIQKWIDSFPIRKQIMDCWFTENPKMEREFQQLVVRENNYSSISNETEYFIWDIEFAEPELGARFDLLAFDWPASNRKSGDVRLALIEMKYGDKALKGDAGIVEHLEQFRQLLSDSDKWKKLCDMAEGQINQLNRLGLLRHTKGDERNFTVNKEKPQVIFLFANHNPRSEALRNELKSLEASDSFSTLRSLCDIRFFIASSAGYAMHSDCMADLDKYKEFMKALI